MALKPKLLIFSEWLSKKSSKLSIALLLILSIIFSVGIFPFFKNLYGLQDQVLLDVLFGFTPKQAYDAIAGYGAYGRKGVFMITGIVDSVFPLVYGALLTLSLSRVTKLKSDHWRKSSAATNIRLINLLPLVVVLFDFIENAGILTMTGNYPNQYIPIAWLTSVAGVLKWVFTVGCIAILLIFWAKKANKKANPKN